ncbi:multiple sugar transport system permease protein [Klenkia marina]|uniref:Multiple sugar transport system permease protein n=1 Tax=Klenkia marina TaxID=1960309 RepID=A0A1G4XQ95_9ACTN|nr:sugar ABC transporter permease [Klenkia marina]SCX43285.1 multiple sugar transport system permease protein [Klenkia marina]
MATVTTPDAPPASSPSRARTRVPRRRPGQRVRQRRRLGALYASPTALFLLVFFVVPVILVLRMSASDWSLFVGDRGANFPTNFGEAVDDRLFWPAIRFTLTYTAITTVILLALALGLALVVQESGRWSAFVRTSFLVPSALGLASASLLFYGLYSPQSSPISAFLEWIGVIDTPVSFLGTPGAALWSTVALVVWRFAGFYMLLLLVGLQAIPGDVFEAARMDGASRFQTFRSITLPLLKPSLALSTILCVTGSLLAFDQFYVLTKGGPDNSTVTIVQLVYSMAFQGQNDLGRAAALSIIVLGGLLVLNALQFLGLRGDRD